MAQDPSVASLLQDDDKRGFTLIEMSIVLVIIGLIIGGILVGQDLIKAAEVTAQVSQIAKYNSAVNTFHFKYGGIPGDLNIPLANQFGFTVGAGFTGNYAGHRDGNGLIDGWESPYLLCQAQCETAQFWADLSTVNLIDGSFPNSGAQAINCSGAAAAVLSTTPGNAYIGDYFPIAKIGHGNFVYVYETGGANWFGLSAITSTASNCSMASSTTIPVIEAYNIDKKVDDGMPTTGGIQAIYINNSATTLSPAPMGPTDTVSTCYSGTAGNYAYSLSATANQGAGLNCALSFKFQ
jgi:prepilin-type N-terminal cleavage/methylation domain-containing protein